MVELPLDLHLSVLADLQPVLVAGAQGRGGLGSDEVVLVLELPVGADIVIDAENAQRPGEAGAIGAAGVVAGRGRGPRGVFAVADIDEPLGHFITILRALLGDFVADAPEHDAGMIAIAIEHARQVALAPLVEEAAVAVRRLARLPFVKGLVHDHEAHRVAEVQQGRIGRVVARADGVAAHALEDFQLPLDAAGDVRPRRGSPGRGGCRRR